MPCNAQEALAQANDGIAPDRRIAFRIGIHVGDVMVRAGDLFGDGVNIAARLQTIAQAGGVCVSGVTYDQVRKVLPMAFTDLGPQQVKNIEEPVRVFAAGSFPSPLVGEGQGGGAIEKPRTLTTTPTPNPSPQGGGERLVAPLSLPDKPSIAVLPFQNMSGDPEQEYFADGMVEDIITALSRFKSLFVIARNSTFTYKGKAVDIKQVGRELGVRYVLEGSVRKAGNRLRITGQLIDVINGAHIWADKFDGALEDVFDLQDRVASSVAGVIQPALMLAEIARANTRPTNDLTAYDLYLRPWPLVRAWAREPVRQALDLAEQAIARDPNYGPALALAAFCRSQMVWSGWLDEDMETARLRGIGLARRAIDAVRRGVPISAVRRTRNPGAGNPGLRDGDMEFITCFRALHPGYAALPIT